MFNIILDVMYPVGVECDSICGHQLSCISHSASLNVVCLPYISLLLKMFVPDLAECSQIFSSEQ